MQLSEVQIKTYYDDQKCLVCPRTFFKRKKTTRISRGGGGAGFMRKRNAITCSKKCSMTWHHLPKKEREKIRGKKYGK